MSNPASPRRHSTPFTTRPAIQSNCRRCHEALSGPMAYCWMCGSRAAGVRWQRLAFQVALAVAPLALAAVGWRMIVG